MIRVGLIGYGYAGRVFHAPLVCATPGFTLAAVASSKPDAVTAAYPRVAVVSDPAALLARDNVDLVVIATPNDSHARLAIAALAAGRHVVIDKPFALTVAEAESVIAAAARARRQLAVFHNRRWDSDFLTVRAAIEDGMIGRVVHCESHFDRFRPQVRDRWREGSGPGAGIWFDLGPHLADQALQLFGMPMAVSADLTRLRDDAVADDWAHVVLHYPDLRVILHASMLAAGGVPRFIAHGTAGTLVKHRPDQQESQLLAGMAPGAAGWGEDDDAMELITTEGVQLIPAVAGDQRRFYHRLGAAIRGEAEAPVPPAQALAVMKIIEAAIKSSHSKKLEALLP